MTRPLRAAFTLFAVLGLVGATSSAARAQCPPNARFCAGVSYGGPVAVPVSRGAQVIITVGPGRQPPPPPPPVVIVRPAPPPPPPVVVYRQAPPPPPVVVYRQAAQPAYSVQRRDVSGTMGLRFFAAGAGGGSNSRAGNGRLGGVGMALRIRPQERFAVDVGAAIYGGTDYEGNERVEIPVTADALFFVNPQHRAQFYLLAGVGGSFAYGQTSTALGLERNYTYVGGQAGAGLEFRLTRGFAINLDVRGFMRAQPGGAPEFQRTTSTGSVETTRTSAGMIGTVGTTLYF